MRVCKRITACALAAVMAFGLLASANPTTAQAAKKPAFSKKKVTLAVGAAKTLKLKNAKKAKKTKWSVKPKGAVTLTKKKKNSVRVKGVKQAKKATVTAKFMLGGKKRSAKCTIVVNAQKQPSTTVAPPKSEAPATNAPTPPQSIVPSPSTPSTDGPAPTEEPTEKPSEEPSEEPTEEPTQEPSEAPSEYDIDLSTVTVLNGLGDSAWEYDADDDEIRILEDGMNYVSTLMFTLNKDLAAGDKVKITVEGTYPYEGPPTDNTFRLYLTPPNDAVGQEEAIAQVDSLPHTWEELTANAAINNFLIKGKTFDAKLPAGMTITRAHVEHLEVGPVEPLPFTAPEDLPRQIQPPDILTMRDGTPVTEANWEERKEEMRAMLEFYLYGPVHMEDGAYDSYSVNAAGTQLTVNVKLGDKTASFNVPFNKPTGAAPAEGFPFVIGAGGGGYWAQMGYAALNVPMYGSTSGAFYTLHPYSAGDWTTATGYAGATAWNVAKLMDALEDGAAEELGVNKDFAIVTGTSRNGKYAACAGAFDERIKVTMPVCSGMGGMSMGRFKSGNTTWNVFDGPASLEFAPGDTASSGTWSPSGNGEGLAVLTGQGFLNENVKRLKDNSWDYLPLDMHWLAALQAGEGRYSFIVSGLSQEGTNGVPGYQWTVDLARPVYEMLGIEKNLAVQIHKQSHGVDQEDLVKILYSEDF